MEYLIKDGKCKSKIQLIKCVYETRLFDKHLDHYGSVETSLYYKELEIKLLHKYNNIKSLRENIILINGKEYTPIKAYIKIIKY